MVVGWRKLVYVLFTTALLFPWQLVAEGQVNYLTLFNTEDGAAIKNGQIAVEPLKEFELIVFGANLNTTLISFSERGKNRGEPCDNDRTTKPITLKTEDETNTKSIVPLKFQVSPNAEDNSKVRSVCALSLSQSFHNILK